MAHGHTQQNFESRQLGGDSGQAKLAQWFQRSRFVSVNSMYSYVNLWSTLSAILYARQGRQTAVLKIYHIRNIFIKTSSYWPNQLFDQNFSYNFQTNCVRSAGGIPYNSSRGPSKD